MLKDAPIVSVCIITYNHEKFISQTLNSVLMQKTSFTFEVVIGEDYSTDNTRSICEEYAQNHKDIIHLLPTNKNYGMVPNFLRTYKQCKGKFIALVEGDDYWIDPYKLEIQFSTLKSNPEYSICFHNAIILWERINKEPKLFNSFYQPKEINFSQALYKWSMATGSIMFKKDRLHIPTWFNEIRNWDWLLQLLLLEKNNGVYINRIMSVYRKHIEGNSFNPDYSDEQTLLRKIDLLTRLLKLFDNKYSIDINLRIRDFKRSLKEINFKNNYKYLYYLLRPKHTLKSIFRKLSLE